MKKSETRERIYDELARALGESDFRLKKNEEAYVRPIPGGRQALGVALYDFHPEFEFALTACVRLDAVEAVFHRFSGSPPKYHAASYTLMVSLDHFTGVRQRPRITSEAAIATAVAALTPTLRENVLPFLEEHRDARAVAHSINHSPTPIDITRHPSRAMHGLILARLTGDTAFEALAERYRDEIREYPESERDKVQRLIAYLQAEPFA